ncbi:MAG: serine/threonine protein kinase [Flavobacteriales bacterium]|jgi:serine/threonine protein kinase
MVDTGEAPPIEPGTTLGDGTRVGEYLGKSAGALNFFGEHVDAGRIVVKVLAPALDVTFQSMRDEFDALRRLRHPALQPLVSSMNFNGRHLLTYAFVDGRTIRSVLAKRVADSGPFDFETTYNVLGHAGAAIEHLHTVMAHGVLTDENVFVLRDGQIQVGNAGYAQLMLRSYGGDGDVFGRSAFLAPEVRDDPWNATPAADIYSLGVLAVQMLTGVQPTRANLPDLLEAAGVNQPAAVGEVLARCLCAEPGARFESLASLRHALSEARMTIPAARGISAPCWRRFRKRACPSRIRRPNASCGGGTPAILGPTAQKPFGECSKRTNSMSTASSSTRSKRPARRLSTFRHSPIL